MNWGGLCHLILWKTTSFLSKPSLRATHSNSTYGCDIGEDENILENRSSEEKDMTRKDEIREESKEEGTR